MSFDFRDILLLLFFVALTARELLPMVLAKFGIVKNGKKPDLNALDEKLKLATNEHYHEMKDEFAKINESLKRVEDNLIRNFTVLHDANSRAGEKLTVILAKMNNK